MTSGIYVMTSQVCFFILLRFSRSSQLAEEHVNITWRVLKWTLWWRHACSIVDFPASSKLRLLRGNHRFSGIAACWQTTWHSFLRGFWSRSWFWGRNAVAAFNQSRGSSVWRQQTASENSGWNVACVLTGNRLHQICFSRVQLPLVEMRIRWLCGVLWLAVGWQIKIQS